MVPLWLFLTITIPLALTVAILAFLRFVKNPLPFPDWGNAGFVLPDHKHRQAVINVLRHFGLSPDFRIDTKDVSRAIYWCKFPFAFDIPSARIAQAVGNPESFVTITVRHPYKAASQAIQMFRDQGFEANAILDPDLSVPLGKLSVVTSSAMPSKILVFRRHIMKMGPKPPTSEKFESSLQTILHRPARGGA